MTTINGTVARGYEKVRDAFAAGQTADPGGAQLCIYRDGAVVADLWTGQDIVANRPYTENSITVLMSCTKGATAVMAAMLAERGLLDIDAPVAWYWPEFAANGKAQVTVAHCLSHTAGLPTFPSAARITAPDLANWQKCVDALAAATPLWSPGQHVSYHAVTYGFLVGEVIRRITGKTPGAFFADEIAKPLGLDFWVGLPAEQERRVAQHIPQEQATNFRTLMATIGVDTKDPVMAEILDGFDAITGAIEFVNTPNGHRCELPAANGIATARSLAKMYAACIAEVDGVRLLHADTVKRFRTSRTKDLTPLAAMAHLPKPPGEGFGLGFMLGSPITKMLGVGSFGHDGAGGRLGFAHPEHRVAAAYTCNSMLWNNLTPHAGWAWCDALQEIVGGRG